MEYLENQQHIKLDIQTAGVQMNEYLNRKIRNMIKKLSNLFPNINWVDIHLKTSDAPGKPRTVMARFGIPGPDLVASDSGSQWKILFRNVEKRLVRQLDKRKCLTQKSKSKAAI